MNNKKLYEHIIKDAKKLIKTHLNEMYSLNTVYNQICNDMKTIGSAVVETQYKINDEYVFVYEIIYDNNEVILSTDNGNILLSTIKDDGVLYDIQQDIDDIMDTFDLNESVDDEFEDEDEEFDTEDEPFLSHEEELLYHFGEDAAEDMGYGPYEDDEDFADDDDTEFEEENEFYDNMGNWDPVEEDSSDAYEHIWNGLTKMGYNEGDVIDAEDLYVCIGDYEWNDDIDIPEFEDVYNVTIFKYPED